MHVHNFDADNINWLLTWTRPWKTTKRSPFSENMPIERWSPTGAQSPEPHAVQNLIPDRKAAHRMHSTHQRRRLIWNIGIIQRKKTASLPDFYNNRASKEFFTKTRMQAYVTEGSHSLNYYRCQLEKGTGGKGLILPCIPRSPVSPAILISGGLGNFPLLRKHLRIPEHWSLPERRFAAQCAQTYGSFMSGPVYCAIQNEPS